DPAMRLDPFRCEIQRTGGDVPPFMAVTATPVEAGNVLCRATAQPISACSGCPHFVGGIPSCGPTSSVRCLHLQHDAIADLMTSVDDLCALDEGDRVRSAGRHPVVVVTCQGRAVGILLAAQLATFAPDAALGRLLSGPVPVVSRNAAVGK